MKPITSQQCQMFAEGKPLFCKIGKIEASMINDNWDEAEDQ